MCVVRQSPEFTYSPRFFSAVLTNGIVSGSLTPADGASASVDADAGSGLGSGAGAGGPSVRLAGGSHPPPMQAIIHAVLERYGSRTATTPLKDRVDDALVSSYAHLRKFLEHKKATLEVRVCVCLCGCGGWVGVVGGCGGWVGVVAGMGALLRSPALHLRGLCTISKLFL
jgi:hypothetical protein